ncbi:putative kinase [Pseudomonas lurida]|uniref:AAA family ATPase n=1 Tax=Pseudomonas lurida TaxID=244566 RepID=UPI001782AC40|nr:AAA family ATPase [Pseudomonas lurida]MBD8666766.1 AAA family ATPase [Pseudomonas lurida]MCF5025629.1 AAA family ATPase [Pseudomonas lurida]MCF5308805.1 AAA family ATPase [Pseudomonas lurida]MCF5326541.1 AAA family ATPase [Pseudomonas lurida]UZQ74401.1 AAA family ATPase [Pseudomonas lurida]
MLIVFSGLPGTGKTTIARELARRTGAVYLRIDVIEQAIRDADVLAGDVAASGYGVANALALSNLQLGNTVVADCVNPVRESRDAWKAVATMAEVELINIRVVCSDHQAHQRRVESRVGDIPGLTPPTWHSVLAHEYEAWDEASVTIDTAFLTPDQAVAMALKRLSGVE